MNDSPGRASSGSSADDGPEPAAPEQISGHARQKADTKKKLPAQWSETQPPPGRWTTPGAQGGPGPAGRWNPGQGSHRQQSAAKPGIVPLRPLGVGEILLGAVAAMRIHWRTVLGCSLAVALVTQGLLTAAEGFLLRDLPRGGAVGNTPAAQLPENLDALGGSQAGTGLTLLFGLLGSILVTAVLTVVVSHAVLGRSLSTGDAWRSARPQLPRLFGLMLLIPLMLVGVLALGAVPGTALVLSGAEAPGRALLMSGLLAGMAAALWMWVRFCLAAPALMLEKQGVTTSLRRSAKLVRGSWWRVCGVQILTQLLLMFVGLLIQIPTNVAVVAIGGEESMRWLAGGPGPVSWTFLIVTGVGAVLAATVSFPVGAGVTAVLYMDQRIRRESLDLELARAAGVPGYGRPSADSPPPDNTASAH